MCHPSVFMSTVCTPPKFTLKSVSRVKLVTSAPLETLNVAENVRNGK